MSNHEYKAHDPARQATSDRFQKGLRDGYFDQLREKSDPPEEVHGMDPEYAGSVMYRTGYETGLAHASDSQRR